MMTKTLEYLNNQSLFGSSWEIIFVNDGSKDKTKDVCYSYVKKYGSDKIRLLHYDQNMGKGFAVQQGALHARGRYVLMVDADGASEITHVERLYNSLKEIINKKNNNNGMGITIGSRAHLQKESESKRNYLRTVLMYGFHLYVYIFGIKTIKDTQCGFKLFTHKSALICFGNQNLTRT
eukprot:UN05542